MKKLGVLVPIVTPCSKSSEVNTEELKTVCSDMLKCGCHGIFVAGSTGRGPWFGRDDRAKICQTIAGHMDSDIPLFAGCMAMGLPEMLENARAMADAGARGVVVTSPSYFSYNQQEIEAIFLRFADDSPLPVVVYDIPDFAGAKLDTDMLCRLAKHENIIGFKDSSTDLQRFKDMIAALSDFKDFYLIQGKENIQAVSLLAGGSGMTVSLLHAGPRLFVALCNAAIAGDAELANDLQKSVTGVMNIMVESFKRRPAISSLFHILNHALKIRGVCSNILLEHEGETPAWLAEQAEKMVKICKDAVEKYSL